MNEQDQLQDFLDYAYVRSHSKYTVLAYDLGVRRFKKFLVDRYDSSLQQITSKLKDKTLDVYELLRDFVGYLDKSNLKPRTIELSINAIKGYLRFVGIKIYSEDFKQVVKMPRKPKTRETPLSKEMLSCLLRNVSPKMQTIVLVAVSSGMRVGELGQLKISDIDFDSKPTIIKIRAETTKTRESRETFLTDEATKSLKEYLRRHFNWLEGEPNDQLGGKTIFGRTSVNKKLKNENITTNYSSSLLQNTLKYHMKKIPSLNKKNENGIHVIHFHAFRKFFRTTVGNVCGRDFAEALMGHRFYMDTYYLLTEEKKRLMYLDAEPHLTISDFKAVEQNLRTVSEKHAQLEGKVNELMEYLRVNSIKIPEFLVS